MSNLSLDTRLTAFANDEHGETEWRNCVECMGLLFTARKTPLCGVCVPVALREAAKRIEELTTRAADEQVRAGVAELRVRALEEALRWARDRMRDETHDPHGVTRLNALLDAPYTALVEPNE